jgi:uncharacterized DUF497 family protein
MKRAFFGEINFNIIKMHGTTIKIISFRRAQNKTPKIFLSAERGRIIKK